MTAGEEEAEEKEDEEEEEEEEEKDISFCPNVSRRDEVKRLSAFLFVLLFTSW